METIRLIARSFKYAFIGVAHILRMERNARIHLLTAILVMALGVYLDVSPGELAAIFFAIIIVFLSEIINTALEKTLDLIEPEHNGKVAIIKDMAAGAVLIASLGSAIIGFVIFRPYIIDWLWRNR
jgi:diacylglycerol kinase (ATP)